MKTHSTITLDRLVNELMGPKAPVMEEEEMLRWISMMPSIRNDITKTMHLIIFGRARSKNVRRYLGQMRRDCTHLLDTLYQYPEFPEKETPLYRSVLDCLLYLIEELSAKYSMYLNIHDKMPVYHYRMAALRIEEKVGALVSAMSAYHADKTLQSLIIAKMTALAAQDAHSWHQITFLGKLQDRILMLCKGQPRNISHGLCALLVKMNFNTGGFIFYCKSKIERELAEVYNPFEKYDLVFDYMRELDLTKYRNRNEQFERNKPGTTEFLRNYMMVQLKYLDSKKVPDKPTGATAAGGIWERLPVAIPVDVLAYFFKLMVRVGVIREVKKSSLVQFICQSFQTPGVGLANLSAQSVESKYRQVTNSSALTLKSILVNMLKNLDDEFG